MADKARILHVLQGVYNYTSLHEGQWEASSAILCGQDVVVRMTTGSGKSLCYQLPVLAMQGKCCLVISPLNSLMNDQVEKLLLLSVPAIAIQFQSSSLTVIQASEYIMNHNFIYMSPETALSNIWLQCFSCSTIKDRIGLLAVDEAHCICQWGKDFRPQFASLRQLRSFLTCPVIALTATAPSQMLKEISTSLCMTDQVSLSFPLDRPNIFIYALKSSSNQKDLLCLLSRLQSSSNPPKSIIYVRRKMKAVELWRTLSSSSHLKVGIHHSSLRDDTRRQVETQFKHGEISVVIATIGFGMGIDIPDVRLVVNVGLPSTVEEWFQMMGRAGRDGQKATAAIVFHPKEINNKSTDSRLKLLLEEGNCIREGLLTALDSEESTVKTDSSQCCTACTKDIKDPNGFIVYEKGRRKRSATNARKYKHKKVTEAEKTALLDALESWRNDAFEREEGKEFLGPLSIVTNRTIRKIVDKCGDLPQVQDLHTISTLKPAYHSAVHDVVMTCVGTFEALEFRPPKRARKTRKRSTTHLQDASAKRRPLAAVN